MLECCLMQNVLSLLLTTDGAPVWINYKRNFLGQFAPKVIIKIYADWFIIDIRRMFTCK